MISSGLRPMYVVLLLTAYFHWAGVWYALNIIRQLVKWYQSCNPIHEVSGCRKQSRSNWCANDKKFAVIGFPTIQSIDDFWAINWPVQKLGSGLVFIDLPFLQFAWLLIYIWSMRCSWNWTTRIHQFGEIRNWTTQIHQFGACD